MKNNTYLLKRIFIIISILCVLFMIVNAFFIYPSADDFSYYTSAKELGFGEFQKWHYMNWGGRYIPNAVLGSFSFDGAGIWYYRMIAISIVLGLFFSFMVFVKNVLPPLELVDRLYISCVLFIGYTLSLYSIAQQFYWMPGSITYTLSCIICLLVWSFFNKTNNWYSFFPLLFAIFIINGSNEISILMFNFSLILFIGFNVFMKRKINHFQYALILFSFLFGAISLLAPGNGIRSEGFENTKSLIYSIPRTINRSAILIFEHLYSILFIAIALLPLLNKNAYLKLNIPNERKKIFALGAFIFPFIILLLGVFPSYWATGKIPPQRAVNTISFFFMITMIFSLLFYYSNFEINKKFIAFIKNKNIGILLLLLALFFPPNYLKTAIRDLLSGKSYTFSQNMKERINYIKSSPEEDIQVPTIEIPSICAKELSEDKYHFYNSAYAKYYNKKSIVIKKEK